MRSRDAARQQDADCDAKEDAFACAPGVNVVRLRAPTPCCAACHAKASEHKKLRACAKCRAVRYCGRECQKAHWGEHKGVCKDVKRQQQ